MSTLKVDNLLNSAGNESPISVPGAAKAWATFDGTAANISSTMTSYNVGSLTDHGDGDYSLNFTNALPNANYGFAGSAGNFNSTSFAMFSVEPRDGVGDERTTNSLRFNCVYVYSGSNRTDFNADLISIFVFGDD